MSTGDGTRKRLVLAFKKLERAAAQALADGGKPRRISIDAVARQAGVSHTLIHTKHPELAERIRSASNRSLLDQRQRSTLRSSERQCG